MKGIVLTLLQQVVTDEHDEDTWDDLIDAAGVDGAYTAVGTYDHAELHALVAAAADALDSTPDEIVVWFGRKALPLLAQRYPELFEGHTSARSFVLTLNDVIHPEVRKLFPGAYAPNFEFDTSDPERIGLTYLSDRGLCRFAEGLVQGAADHFGEHAEVVHDRCTRDGADGCTLTCRFVPVA
ncbi:MAG TPA: heme NO-binding domain-containing protein [Nitriliruptorales bacterium]